MKSKIHTSSRQPFSIKAFTLSELLVVLIITTIVVGLAFTVLQLVQKQIYAIKTNYTHSMDLNTLETALWLDFNRYSTIEFDADNQILRFKHALDSMDYRFFDRKIIRDLDTLDIPFQNKIMYFDGEVTSFKKIDAIQLITDSSFQNQELFIFKHNDAAMYFER